MCYRNQDTQISAGELQGWAALFFDDRDVRKSLLFDPGMQDLAKQKRTRCAKTEPGVVE